MRIQYNTLLVKRIIVVCRRLLGFIRIDTQISVRVRLCVLADRASYTTTWRFGWEGGSYTAAFDIVAQVCTRCCDVSG